MKAKPTVANIITPHSLETLLLNLFNANSIKVAITMKGAVIKSSGKAVTEATNTVPTTTLLRFRQEDSPEAPLTTLLEPQ